MQSNYYQLLNNFYDLLQCNYLSKSAQLLYHTLLMINNRTGWTEWFQRTNESLCDIMRMDKRTLKNARNELKQQGLIDFIQTKKKGEITKYKILDCKIGVQNSTQNTPQNAPQNVPQNAPQNVPHINTNTNTKIKENKKEKFPYGEFQKVMLTEEEYKKLVDKLGEKSAIDYINRLDAYIASKNKKYYSHYATLVNWSRKELCNTTQTSNTDINIKKLLEAAEKRAIQERSENYEVQ